jgi:hypothetical protein
MTVVVRRGGSFGSFADEPQGLPVSIAVLALEGLRGIVAILGAGMIWRLSAAHRFP